MTKHAEKSEAEKVIRQFMELSEAPAEGRHDESLFSEAALMADSLESSASLKSLANDPYWPKWDSPWWKAQLLLELNLAHLISDTFIEAFADALNKNYLHFFPLKEEDIPKGKDPYRNIICHCALGSALKLLITLDYDLKNFSWMTEWIEKYQLPDGGYNCEEQAYNNSKKSSFLSTMPMLEAALMMKRKWKLSSFDQVLEKGVNYMYSHSLCRSTQGKLIDKSWLKPVFPRFYQYDVLRGMAFLSEWHIITETTPDLARVEESFEAVANILSPNGFVQAEKQNLISETNIILEKKKWKVTDRCSSFKLLDSFVKGGENLYLTKQWFKTLSNFVERMQEN